MRINQTKVSVICQSEAEADNVDRGLNNSDILHKLNSIIFLLFTLQKKSHAVMRLGIEANKKLKVKVIFSPEKTKKGTSLLLYISFCFVRLCLRLFHRFGWLKPKQTEHKPYSNSKQNTK